MSLGHIVLLGDSIFDNARYVPGQSDVVAQVRDLLPAGWTATLRAVDGVVIRDVGSQLRYLPDDATHLVLSAGGNDALVYAARLGAPARSFDDALLGLAEIQDSFRLDFRSLLKRLQESALPATACTIYDAVPGLDRVSRTGLSLLNDVIVFECVRAGLNLIDLRLICDDPADFSEISPIEPSFLGGSRIARAIATAVLGSPSPQAASTIYV